MRATPARFLPKPLQVLAWATVAIGVSFLSYVVWYLFTHALIGAPGRDIHNYILAGLRLNEGHPLYTYGPGDEVVPSGGGFSDYALYSPPLIGVVFRLIVLLPANGQYISWIAMDALELLAIAMLVRRAPLLTGVALMVLGVPIGVLLEFGNVDCLVAFGMLAAWRWLVEGHDERAAILIAVLASLKLTPVIFVWWLYVTGRRRAAAVGIGVGVGCGLIAMAGSEPLIMVKFLQVTTTNVAGPATVTGAAGLATVLGLPSVLAAWLPRVILISGIGAMWVARRTPGISFAIGASLMWLASPVASVHTPALILVALGPAAWPMARSIAGGKPESSGRTAAPHKIEAMAVASSEFDPGAVVGGTSLTARP
ncbi:MAG: glycosyltransferase family 87 protein [Candidatus Limnocylindrales bacterium]